MKRFLLPFVAVLLSAAPDTGHKVLWYHYPPGLNGADRFTSGSVVIEIDRRAIAAHLAHRFDHELDYSSSCTADIG